MRQLPMTRCPACSATHEHLFMYCQTCEEPMNVGPGRFSGMTFDLPTHFTAANRDGYTQRELMRENDDAKFDAQGGRRVMARS